MVAKRLQCKSERMAETFSFFPQVHGRGTYIGEVSVKDLDIVVDDFQCLEDVVLVVDAHAEVEAGISGTRCRKGTKEDVKVAVPSPSNRVLYKQRLACLEHSTRKK